MQPGNLDSFSLSVLIPVFIASAALVFFAGTSLSKVVDELSDRTGMGKAFTGTLFLGGITSLPEIATTITAAVQNNPGMATNNLLGGIAMQVTILTLADALIKKQTLSSLSSHTVILLQGIALILTLSILAGFILAPPYSLFHIGIGSPVIVLMFLASLYMIQRYRTLQWLNYSPSNKELLEKNLHLLQDQVAHAEEALSNEKAPKQSFQKAITSKLGLWLLGLSVLILMGGCAIVISIEAIATKTGLSTNFAGFLLVAVSTSLPEVSTVISAVKIKQYEMALSNVIGTNLFDVSLIFLADLFYFKGSILQEADNFSLLGIALGIAVTSVYMLGLIIRSEKMVSRIGYDSLLVLILYLTGIVILFSME